LRRRQLDGLHFRRQSPIGRYVADFLCVDARVIVEVDGGHHTGTRSDHDRKRTLWLESQGYRVIRFSNNGVLEHLDDVLETILARIDEAPPPRPSPSEEGEGAGPSADMARG
jgi:very-short-patch-repair endonuclease